MGPLTPVFAFIVHHPFAALFLATLVVLIDLSIRRLYFHPLAKFPGPKLAALTIWYEFYYDGLKRGKYTFEIKRMHEKYGPIVRISPDELHVNDPEFIDQLYSSGIKRRDKCKHFTLQFGTSQSTLTTLSHGHHRLRRSALNPFFSKASVTKFEPRIKGAVQKLCRQIEKHAGSKKPVTISSAFSCLTADVITEYSFARSTNLLSTNSPAFETNLHDSIIAGRQAGLFKKTFPWLHHVFRYIPEWIITKLNPNMPLYTKIQEDLIKQAREVKDEPFEKTETAGNTIFQEISNANLPKSEKTVSRLSEEAQMLVGAGTETTAWTLTVMVYHLLANPEILSKVRGELKIAVPDPSNLPPLESLEQLPHLTAVITESLRLSYGISTRSQRISPHEPLIFKSQMPAKPHVHDHPTSGGCKTVEYEIPPGTPVGMTSVLVHHNLELFPDSNSFIPERFIDSKGKRRRDLEGYILSFSKGTRACLGINLAYAELYFGIAGVIRHFGDRMKLFETTSRDVEMDRDLFIPVPMDKSKGVRVVVNSK